MNEEDFNKRVIAAMKSLGESGSPKELSFLADELRSLPLQTSTDWRLRQVFFLLCESQSSSNISDQKKLLKVSMADFIRSASELVSAIEAIVAYGQITDESMQDIRVDIQDIKQAVLKYRHTES